MLMGYLYGAAIQGIQQFIFQTNELQDIAGASELVEKICTSAFRETLGPDWKEDNLIVGAAGNIKYLFEAEDVCRRVVRLFPKKILTMAPGITVSQAVVEYSGDFDDAINRIEASLKTQRNIKPKSLTAGMMGMRRSRKTGLPVVCFRDGEFLDETTLAKKNEHNLYSLCKKSFYGKGIEKDAPVVKELSGKMAYDVGKMTGKNDWIAVVHADGNGLGQVVRKVGKHENDFKRFSKLLDEATVMSANDAFVKVQEQFCSDKIIPIRPVVLGGDDMTVILRGSIAMPYVTEFLRGFETHTGELLGDILKKYNVFDGKNHLTACAGIAFIKSSYPFYYGYELAEQLCAQAKKDAKGFAGEGRLAPSCLMFHKVEDSFVESYKNIVERELSPQNDVSYMFGPYYLMEGNKPDYRITADRLEGFRRDLERIEDRGVKTGLRQWLTLMSQDLDKARQRLDRMMSLLSDRDKECLEGIVTPQYVEGKETYAVFDILSYMTITNQNTTQGYENN